MVDVLVELTFAKVNLYLQVWWEVLCVNLPGLRDVQGADKTLSLQVSSRVFLEGLVFELI